MCACAQTEWRFKIDYIFRQHDISRSANKLPKITRINMQSSIDVVKFFTPLFSASFIE